MSLSIVVDTPRNRAAIVNGRRCGQTWEQLSRALGLDIARVFYFGTKTLGLPGGLSVTDSDEVCVPTTPYEIARSHGRPDIEGPLPAGHPYAWNVLTAGTLLEGSAFHPTFS